MLSIFFSAGENLLEIDDQKRWNSFQNISSSATQEEPRYVTNNNETNPCTRTT